MLRHTNHNSHRQNHHSRHRDNKVLPDLRTILSSVDWILIRDLNRIDLLVRIPLLFTLLNITVLRFQILGKGVEWSVRSTQHKSTINVRYDMNSTDLSFKIGPSVSGGDDEDDLPRILHLLVSTLLLKAKPSTLCLYVDVSFAWFWPVLFIGQVWHSTIMSV